jgi:hypothetical protein
MVMHTAYLKTTVKSWVCFPTAFSQAIDKHENYYAFPPYCLLASVIRFIIDEQINCTLIFPHFIPVPNWFTYRKKFPLGAALQVPQNFSFAPL